MVVPVYNAEISPKNLRGRLVALNQLFITAGIMVYIILKKHLIVLCTCTCILPVQGAFSQIISSLHV